MRVKIDDINPDTGLEVDLSDTCKEVTENLKQMGLEVLSGLSGCLDVTKTKGALTVEGKVRAEFSTPCSRCLKPVRKTVDRTFKNSYLLLSVSESEEGNESEITDLTSDYIASDVIETDDFFIEQIALEAPDRELCTDNCKGLCTKCGTDLNEGSCQCKPEDKIDPRFAKLKDFKVK